MNAIILLGPPGAGKGSLAESLVREGYTHVSTGDMLREAFKNETAVGLEAKSYMDRGALVPDDVIINIIRERLGDAPADEKFMFDGFPRTLNQAQGLDQLITDLNGVITHVIMMECPDEMIIKRLSGRRICRSCGAVYHVTNKPSKVDGVCDFDGGELYQRDDDNEDTVRNRLSVYTEQTKPLVAYYADKNLICPIDASGSIQLSVDSALSYLNG
ncbi:MAG: adenylate kinase [Kiritimatiellales bacterium]|nr:adenylate kinase [Kiritimatiellales bacterium]